MPFVLLNVLHPFPVADGIYLDQKLHIQPKKNVQISSEEEMFHNRISLEDMANIEWDPNKEVLFTTE